MSSDALVTDENLLRLLTSPGAAFKLVNSPIIEAAEMVDKVGHTPLSFDVDRATFVSPPDPLTLSSARHQGREDCQAGNL